MSGIPLNGYYHLLNILPVVGHLSCFQFLAVMNEGVHFLCVWQCFSTLHVWTDLILTVSYIYIGEGNGTPLLVGCSPWGR